MKKKKKKENLNIQGYSQPTRLSFFFRSYPIDIQDTRYRIFSSNTRTHAKRDDIRIDNWNCSRSVQLKNTLEMSCELATGPAVPLAGSIAESMMSLLPLRDLFSSQTANSLYLKIFVLMPSERPYYLL